MANAMLANSPAHKRDDIGTKLPHLNHYFYTVCPGKDSLHAVLHTLKASDWTSYGPSHNIEKQLFIKRHAVLLEQTGVRLSASAMTAIRNHRWKGNVRELEAAVRRALVVADEDTIQAADLSLETPKEAIDEILPLAQVRDRHLREYVQRVVERCGGNRTAAAKALMVTPRTIFKYLEEV